MKPREHAQAIQEALSTMLDDVPDNQKSTVISHLYVWLNKEGGYREPKQRSGQENNALYLWLTQVAKQLNEAGFDMRVVLKPDVDIPWTKESAKLNLWDPIMRAQFGYDSTRQMKASEPCQVSETIARHLGDKLGITLPPWPSIETMPRKKIQR